MKPMTVQELEKLDAIKRELMDHYQGECYEEDEVDEAADRIFYCVHPTSFSFVDADAVKYFEGYGCVDDFEPGEPFYYDDDMPINYAGLRAWSNDSEPANQWNALYSSYALDKFDEWLAERGFKMSDDCKLQKLDGSAVTDYSVTLNSNA